MTWRALSWAAISSRLKPSSSSSPGTHCAEGGDQLGADAREGHWLTCGVLELEILHPGGRAVRPVQTVGTLGNDMQTEVLEGRQYFGDRQRLTPPQDAQMNTVGALAMRAVQTQLHRLGGSVEAFQVGDVVHRGRGLVIVLAVGRRKRGRIAPLERAARGSPKRAAQRDAQPVTPGHQRSVDLALEPCRVRARIGVRIDPHDHVQQRQRRVTDRQARVESRCRAMPCAAARSMRSCAAASQRSRGRNTRHDQKRRNSSRRAPRARARALAACSTARAHRIRSATVACNSSSRGRLSRICTRRLPS